MIVTVAFFGSLWIIMAAAACSTVIAVCPASVCVCLPLFLLPCSFHPIFTNLTPYIHFYPSAFWPEGYCLWLILTVRLITLKRLELHSPNPHTWCILGPSRLVLKMDVIDLYLQGHFGHKLWNACQIELVRAITFRRCVVFAPNFHKRCI